MQDPITQATIHFVKQMLENAEAGHDWWHIQRVWTTTRLLLKTENADPLVCDLGALLHDIADHKFFRKEERNGPELARAWLKEQKLDADRIEKVVDIIKNISFKGGLASQAEKSPELQVVQDADRLDAMGAIGIARAFHYGGYKNRKLYDPEIKPVTYTSAEDYISSDAPTINHFYEKLLLLKGLMNTETGKRLAEERHTFMEYFLDRFLKEWNGEN